MDINMNLDDAYYLVFKDLTKEDGVLTGRYDAKNGNNGFMYGVLSVMELIAYRCGNDCLLAFDNKFIYNMIKSEEKAEQTEPKMSEIPTGSEPQWTKENCKGCKYNEYPYDSGTCFVRVCINGNKYEPKDEPQTITMVKDHGRKQALEMINLYHELKTEPQTLKCFKADKYKSCEYVGKCDNHICLKALSEGEKRAKTEPKMSEIPTGSVPQTERSSE